MTTLQDRYNNLLLKKIQGAPYTDINVAFSGEQPGSSTFNITPKNIYTQSIPINPGLTTAGASSNTNLTISGSTTLNSKTIGKKYIFTTYPYIFFYEKVLLRSVVAGFSFVYAGTTDGDKTGTNLLTNAIPSTFDPIGNYAISVFNTDDFNRIVSPIDTWYFDVDSGYLTFFNQISWTPAISFWRYEGDKLTTSLTVTGQIKAASFNAGSDYRLKTNIVPLLENKIVDYLKPVEYDLSGGVHDMGFIAHEVQEHFPFLVNGEKDGENMQSINYNGFIPLLVKEIQQLKSTVKILQDRIELLESSSSSSNNPFWTNFSWFT